MDCILNRSRKVGKELNNHLKNYWNMVDQHRAPTSAAQTNGFIFKFEHLYSVRWKGSISKWSFIIIMFSPKFQSHSLDGAYNSEWEKEKLHSGIHNNYCLRFALQNWKLYRRYDTGPTIQRKSNKCYVVRLKNCISLWKFLKKIHFIQLS